MRKTKAEDGALDALLQKLRTEIDGLTEGVASGGCTNYPDYTAKTGIIRGLERAADMLLDIDDRMLES